MTRGLPSRLVVWIVRFRRGDNGATEVSREPGVSEQQQIVATQAKAQGAEQRWVTKDGYTQLPQQMREELGVGNGSHVWFLKNQGRWQAWPEPELESLLSTEGQEAPDGASDSKEGDTGG